jgi:serine protease Do
MKDALERTAAKPATVSIDVIARQQRQLILALMTVALLFGVLVGAVLTKGAFADSDNRVVVASQGAITDALSESFARAAATVEPAVVHIDVRNGGRNSIFDREAKGSGVIVTDTGFVLTNNHVIDEADKIRVRLYDRREFDATVVGHDPDTDLAVLKIQGGADFPFARFGDSSRLRVGDWVLAVGSPFGLEQTVTAGIISAKDRETEGGASAFQQFLQTDAAINPGNSGGPLVNLAGEVVGINTQIATRTGAFSGIGFALPSSTAIGIYNQLAENGRINRGFLGVEVDDLTTELARENGLSSTDGVLIRGVSGDPSPAALGGLQPGDIVTEINGETVKDRRDLIRRIGSFPAGTVVKLTYVRKSAPATATVKLGDREEGIKASRPANVPDDEEEDGVTPDLPPGHPEIRPRGQAPSERDTGFDLGLSVRTLTPDLARDRSLDGLVGVYVLSVEQRSIAAEKGILPGDVIISINQRRIGSEADFDQRISGLESGDRLRLDIQRRVGSRIERRFIMIVVP